MSASLTRILGDLLGVEQAQKIDSIEPSLGAAWARSSPAWLFFGLVALAVVALVFYARYQQKKHPGTRAVLAVLRAAALGLILLLLAEPILRVHLSSQRRPVVWLLLDGTDSMAIADELPEDQRTALDEATGYQLPEGQPEQESPNGPTRTDYVRSALSQEKGELLKKLAAKARLRAFLFDKPEGARMLELTADGRDGVDGEHVAGQLTAEGEVTALGAALNDLARRHSTASLAGVIVVSDFNQNAGPAALRAAGNLGVPIYSVGVGAKTAPDIALAVQAPPHVKEDEATSVEVTVRQEGLSGETVQVRLAAERLGGFGAASPEPIALGEKTVTLSGSVEYVEFPYLPEDSGRFQLVANVEPLVGEVVEENNRAIREITVTDEVLRLLFVEYEPTWEWRFIKEVFHRDKLVGMKGFRTFLRSADPRVRQTNPMFLPTMSPPRNEFFEYDVIFLSDLPPAALSPRFCEMTEEFVRAFGGGLVILCGPRFGPAGLVDTDLERLLPVKVDPGASVYNRQPFLPRLTPAAEQYKFMQLADNSRSNARAWANLGRLPWYQPVERLHPLATALAEHPSHTCVDGKTRQPLIAVRRYGRGEVVFFGFNETWRLRKKHGEKYYRQLWGQMIQRLSLSHALGSQKRFVVRTDRRRYQADDEVIVTVEAYNADFEPLTEDDLPQPTLRGELVLPAQAGREAESSQALTIPQQKPGVFETRFPVYAGGEHRVLVHDPVTGQGTETAFQVTSLTVERQRAVRNLALQQAIALETGGKSFDLSDIGRLADEIDLLGQTETSVEVIPLWNSWFCFLCVVGLLLGEWLLRKWVNLS